MNLIHAIAAVTTAKMAGIWLRYHDNSGNRVNEAHGWNIIQN